MHQKNYNDNLPQIEKCALWKNTSKNGNNYLAGTATVNGKVYRIVVFENPFKCENAKRPDYNFDAEKFNRSSR